MLRRSVQFFLGFLTTATLVAATNLAQERNAAHLNGTLVVAVPVKEGLVVCADKRIYNADDGSLSDDFIKIRKVNDKTLFAATNTVGLYDGRKKKVVFDAFAITEEYVARSDFAAGKAFWDGLKNEIRAKLRAYLSERKFAEWPVSDRANNNLLFNLIFYSVREGRAYSHSLRVFYEKAKTPIIYIEDPVREEITKPKLSGKGREIMSYLARPSAAIDQAILRFDETRFSRADTTAADAVEFSRQLFKLTNTRVPKAQVSLTFDCALLDHVAGFRKIG